MLARDVIQATSVDLNDQEPGYEYTHWPYEQLRHYLFEAMQQICQVAHKLFLQRKIIKLESGATWYKACCDCDQIIRIIGEVDDTGNLLHTLRRIDDNPDNEWPTDVSNACSISDKDYEMEGYSISRTDDTYFQVVPAIPDGAVRYVMLECFVGIHDLADDYDVSWRFVSMVKMWMLGRAYMMDSENTSALFQLGERYISLWGKMFGELLTNMDKEDKEKEIGNDNMGAVPNNSSQ